MKLWEKGIEVNKLILDFTVGNDYLLDKKLVKYDCIASKAHAKMLAKINILTQEEASLLISGLDEIIKLSLEEKFDITKEEEDCHTAIENYLTAKFGEIGKKIHSCRSRNDQVLSAIRLYEKNELCEIFALLDEFIFALELVSAKNKDTPMPGYTHMQKAMPTTISDWLGCFVESAKDNKKTIEFIAKLINQSPLGSAAGFGVPIFKIEKEFTAKEMGFEKPISNPIYAQLTRAKFDSLLLHGNTQIMFDLNKLANDLITFSTKEFNYISLPKEFCTGSSIMPQKNNPDALELVRANYHIVLGEEFKQKSLIANLLTGYNRDIQLTKGPVINSIETVKNCLKIMILLVEKILVNEENCLKAMTCELYATEEAYALVKQGIPFRDAYKEVGKKYSNNSIKK